MTQGTLYIVSAPSGAGKTSLVNALMTAMPDLVVSISHTTRAKRPAEQEGVNYYFVDRDTFQTQLAAGHFLEHASVFGHYYGTAEMPVKTHLQSGIDVVLEIDWQGAQQVRKKIPDSVGIFILPPSLSVLRTRLQTRAQDNSTTINMRMSQADEELSHYKEYDYLVVNDTFDVALADLCAIVRARRLRRCIQQSRLEQLITE